MCGTGLDQVGNRFGLGQVELVVEKGTFTELTRTRQSCAQLQAALQQHVEHHGAAVALQLQHVLPGKGVRAGEVQQQALVNLLTVSSLPGAIMCVTWAWLQAAELFGNSPGQRA